ncbi:MAG TPA: IS110 family transposase [Candidatus Angelobacter sp.]|nr:IS110 family transposase [Candidatus Angelobacter sp.]
MKIVATIGLDIAKQVFQVHGADKSGRPVLRRKLRRGEVARFFCEISPCLIGIEASGSAHYWARVLGGMGHTVRLMAPQFVKPYVKSQKNDANDAEAICEAVTRPNMRFVPQKSVEQQDLQCLHRVRSRLVACRTQLINQIRGLLAEYGIVLPQHPGQVRSGLPAVLEDAENQLTGFGRGLFRGLYEELAQLDEKIAYADNRIQIAFQAHPDCRRIAAVEGVGPLIATAIVAAISNGHAFENGRQFSAWLGLVPRQNSSGGKSRLMGITKRGDPYLRTLLIHGARSVVFRAKAKSDKRSLWITDKQQRLGTTKACVAVANKNARIIWSLIAREQEYRRAA